MMAITKKTVLVLFMASLGAYYFWHGRQLTKATSAEDFVRKWSQAYTDKDVDRVMAMTARRRSSAADGLSNRQLAAKIEDNSLARQRAELEKEFAEGGMWQQAGAQTRYLSERQHGDHLHVTVMVAEAHSEIILVWEDGYLKAAPDPEAYD